VIYKGLDDPRFAKLNLACRELLFRSLLYARDDGRCQLCGLSVDFFEIQVDHVVPRSQGGRTEWTNLQVAHPLCNQRKGAKILGPDGIPDENPVTVICMKGSRAYAKWMNDLHRATGIPKAHLARVAVEEWAERHKHPKPPEI
jgi:hypothetical protein